MKNVNIFIRHLLSLIFLIVIGFYNCSAQKAEPSSAENKLLTPAEEKFQKTDALIAPWRNSGCLETAKRRFNEPNCYQVTGTDWLKTANFILYNDDGTVWYNFTFSNKDDPQSILRNPKSGFSPLFVQMFLKDEYPNNIVFRMVGESLHWSEIEVNEQTRETKFISKSDLVWAKRDWNYWLYQSTDLVAGKETLPLHDKPDGRVIEGTGDFPNKNLRFLKAEGEWAFVETRSPAEHVQGWIRWRKGRDILVGYIFNGYEVPSSEK